MSLLTGISAVNKENKVIASIHMLFKKIFTSFSVIFAKAIFTINVKIHYHFVNTFQKVVMLEEIKQLQEYIESSNEHCNELEEKLIFNT